MIFNNQRQYKGQSITNVINRPILHKHNKQWIVLGLSALTLGTLGAFNLNNANASSVQTNHNQSQTNQNVQAKQPVQAQSANTQNISSLATHLHDNLMASQGSYLVHNQAQSNSSNVAPKSVTSNVAPSSASSTNNSGSATPKSVTPSSVASVPSSKVSLASSSTVSSSKATSNAPLATSKINPSGTETHFATNQSGLTHNNLTNHQSINTNQINQNSINHKMTNPTQPSIKSTSPKTNFIPKANLKMTNGLNKTTMTNAQIQNIINSKVPDGDEPQTDKLISINNLPNPNQDISANNDAVTIGDIPYTQFNNLYFTGNWGTAKWYFDGTDLYVHGGKIDKASTDPDLRKLESYCIAHNKWLAKNYSYNAPVTTIGNIVFNSDVEFPSDSSHLFSDMNNGYTEQPDNYSEPDNFNPYVNTYDLRFNFTNANTSNINNDTDMFKNTKVYEIILGYDTKFDNKSGLQPNWYQSISELSNQDADTQQRGAFPNPVNITDNRTHIGAFVNRIVSESDKAVKFDDFSDQDVLTPPNSIAIQEYQDYPHIKFLDNQGSFKIDKTIPLNQVSDINMNFGIGYPDIQSVVDNQGNHFADNDPNNDDKTINVPLPPNTYYFANGSDMPIQLNLINTKQPMGHTKHSYFIYLPYNVKVGQKYGFSPITQIQHIVNTNQSDIKGSLPQGLSFADPTKYKPYITYVNKQTNGYEIHIPNDVFPVVWNNLKKLYVQNRPAVEKDVERDSVFNNEATLPKKLPNDMFSDESGGLALNQNNDEVNYPSYYEDASKGYPESYYGAIDYLVSKYYPQYNIKINNNTIQVPTVHVYVQGKPVIPKPVINHNMININYINSDNQNVGKTSVKADSDASFSINPYETQSDINQYTGNSNYRFNHTDNTLTNFKHNGSANIYVAIPNGSIKINYIDKNSNQVVGSTTATDKINTPFNINDYHNINYANQANINQFTHRTDYRYDHDVINANQFNQNTGTDEIYVHIPTKPIIPKPKVRKMIISYIDDKTNQPVGTTTANQSGFNVIPYTTQSDITKFTGNSEYEYDKNTVTPTTAKIYVHIPVAPKPQPTELGTIRIDYVLRGSQINTFSDSQGKIVGSTTDTDKVGTPFDVNDYHDINYATQTNIARYTGNNNYRYDGESYSSTRFNKNTGTADVYIYLWKPTPFVPSSVTPQPRSKASVTPSSASKVPSSASIAPQPSSISNFVPSSSQSYPIVPSDIASLGSKSNASVSSATIPPTSVQPSSASMPSSKSNQVSSVAKPVMPSSKVSHQPSKATNFIPRNYNLPKHNLKTPKRNIKPFKPQNQISKLAIPKYSTKPSKPKFIPNQPSIIHHAPRNVGYNQTKLSKMSSIPTFLPSKPNLVKSPVAKHLKVGKAHKAENQSLTKLPQTNERKNRAKDVAYVLVTIAMMLLIGGLTFDDGYKHKDKRYKD